MVKWQQALMLSLFGPVVTPQVSIPSWLDGENEGEFFFKSPLTRHILSKNFSSQVFKRLKSTAKI